MAYLSMLLDPLAADVNKWDVLCDTTTLSTTLPSPLPSASPKSPPSSESKKRFWAIADSVAAVMNAANFFFISVPEASQSMDVPNVCIC